MAITKANIKEILRRYMIQNNLGYIEMHVSLSMDSSKVIISMTEEEDDIDEKFYLN